MLLLIFVMLLTLKVSRQGQECDVFLRNFTGMIASPDTDNDGLYENGLYCKWAIFAGDNKIIELKFLEMDIEFEYTCQFDYLRVIDGDFEIGKFCGTEIPEPIVSEARQMLLIFYSDEFIQKKGFKASYRNLEDEMCGYRVSRTPGRFGSMDNDSDGLYDASSSCVWSVSRPYYYRSSTTVLLQVYLTDLDIQQGDDCQFDYIEVLDNGTSVGRYCGSTQPPMITSRSDVLEIRFESDRSRNGRGFTAYYANTNPTGECGGVLVETTGEIHSVDLDENGLYDSEAYCRWLIVAETSATIELIFLTFELEADRSCNYDAVLVYDDVSTFRGSNLIGRFCGDSLPNPIYSSTNVLCVVFKSDQSDSYSGFSATYTQITGVSCVYVRNGLSGRFGPDDNDFDGLYDINLNCTWEVNVPSKDGLVQVYITDLDIQQSTDCQLDYVEVLDNGTSFGKYCGSSQPPVITSSSNVLEIHFKSDGSVNGRGFIAYYTLTDISGECGGILTKQTGEIISVDRDGNGFYDFDLDCRWLIIAEKGSLVELKFPQFKLEYDSTCLYDYIVIHEGDFTGEDFIGYYCGDNIPYVILSTTNIVRVHFSTDASTVFSGFHATYMFVKERTCSSQYSNMPGRFGLPDSDSDGLYDLEFSCTWYVFGSKGKLVQIYLTGLDIEQSDNCQHDYIEVVYEGGSAGRYCGSTQPPVIASTSNVAEIRFESNGSVNDKGFIAYYADTDSTGVCGGILTEPVGGLTSLNTGTGHDIKYQDDLDCRWLIVAVQDSVVELHFLTFDLEYDSLCSYDYVLIHDGAFLDENTIIGRFCGHEIPVPVISTANVLCVQFKTDSFHAVAGFNASYRHLTVSETTTQAGQITDVTNGVNTNSTMSSYTEEMTDVLSSIALTSTTDASVLETTKSGTTNTEAITNLSSKVSTHLTLKMVALNDTKGKSTDSFDWTSDSANTVVTVVSESAENHTNNAQPGNTEITKTVTEDAMANTTDIGLTLQTVSEPAENHTDASLRGTTELAKILTDDATQNITDVEPMLETTDDTTLTNSQAVGSAEKIVVTYISQYLPWFACMLGLLCF